MRTRIESFLTRRRILEGTAAVAAASLLSGCTGSATTPPPSISTSSLPAATVNVAYSVPLTATGGSGTGYTWTLTSGTLPAGLALSAVGLITGTPTTPGTSSFSVKVTDSAGSSSTASLSIAASYSLFTITTSSLIDAIVSQSYQVTLVASGGTGAGYVWTLTSGTFPAGLVLSAAGVISGTATALGNGRITIKVTDSASNNASATFTIVVTNPQKALSGALINASVSISSASAGTVGSNFVGFSLGKNLMNAKPYSLTGTNSGLVNLFMRVTQSTSPNGPPILRIGGSQVEDNIWTASGVGGIAKQIAPSDIAALAGFAAATGWQCIYGINLASSAPGSVPLQTPALAAAEVVAVVAAFASAGALTPWFEIGNECDNYGHNGHSYNGVFGWGLSYFENLWSTYRAAIVATTPSAIITGPASGNNEATWTEPFATFATKLNISLMTQHYYKANSTDVSATLAGLIAYPDPTLAGYLPGLTQAAQNIGVPWRMSETNSFNSAGANGALGVANGYGSALWVMDHMFSIALGGGSGVNMSGDSNQPTGYQALSYSGGAVTSVNPEYYGILMFALAGYGTLLSTTVSASGANITAYAVKTASSGINIIILNKDMAQNLQATVTLPQTVSNAALLLLTQLTTGNSGPSLAAASGVTIQGSNITTSGAFSPGVANTITINGGTTVTCQVPYLSAVILQLS
jgi:hypothetical protein